MFPLGHLGLTLALVLVARRGFTDFRVDYRLLLVGALLPDLIDKPLSLVLGVAGRNLAHTFLFTLTLTFFFLILRSRPTLRSRAALWVTFLLAFAIGSGTHLLLDRMWALPEILLWPFLGLPFPLEPFGLLNLLEAYQDPYVLIGDAVGAAVLGYMAWRHRLYRRANFLRLLRKGRLETGEAPSIP